MYDLKQDFIDAPELAQMINRTLATVHAQRKQGKIPQPKARLNTVYLWDRKQIMDWYAENNGVYTFPPDIEPCNDPCFYCGGVK